MAVWAAVLIVYGVAAQIAMVAYKCSAIDVYPLDMAPNSVDDMYDGCNDKMLKKTTEYLKNELTDGNFKEAWDKAETYYNGKSKTGMTSLGKEQIMAIHVYTLPDIYRDFNNAVRTQEPYYKTTFKYHALHFFLTDALQKLNKNAKGCLTGFRRVNRYFSQDVLNKEIRFGSFTSSSLAGYIKPEIFGDKSCFEIFTCFGANITEYSRFEEEEEVLIPPYEVFKVIKIERKSDQSPCEVVYKVKSMRTHSNLNCTLF